MNELVTDLVDRPSPVSAAPALAVTSPACSPSLRVAIASTAAGAAIVHFAMVPAHYQASAFLGLAFAAAAWFQIGLAARVLVRPSRRALVVGAIGSSVIIAGWALSRTVGLPLPGDAGAVEAAGLVDLTCVGFEVATVLGCALGLCARPSTGTRSRHSSVLAAMPAAAVLIVTTAVLASPQGADHHGHGATETATVAEEHTHESGADAHGHDEAASDAETVGHATPDAAEHDHADASPTPTEVHDHDHSAAGPTDAAGDAPTDAATSAPTSAPVDAHSGHSDHAMPAHLDHEPTEGQLADARALINETKAATSGLTTVSAAKAAGYASIGDGRSGFEHFVNIDYATNETILDPSQPESLVFKVLPDGGRELTTIMYIMPTGTTIEDVPDVAGNLTMWHGHDNLCFEPGSVRISGVVLDGSCRPRGVAGTAPMLHVWVTPNPCGPFAGTDAEQQTGSCVNDPRLATP